MIYLSRGQFDQAREVIEKTITLCRELELKIDEGMSWRVLGQVFSANGQIDQASEAFEHSLALLQDDGYELVRTQLEWGRALLATDHTQATTLLREACVTFERLDARRDLVEVTRILNN